MCQLPFAKAFLRSSCSFTRVWGASAWALSRGAAAQILRHGFWPRASCLRLSLPPSLLFPPGNLVCIMLEPPLEPFTEGGHDVIGAALRSGGEVRWAAAATAASHFHSIPFHSQCSRSRRSSSSSSGSSTVA